MNECDRFGDLDATGLDGAGVVLIGCTPRICVACCDLNCALGSLFGPPISISMSIRIKHRYGRNARRLPTKGLGMFKSRQDHAKAAEFGQRVKSPTDSDESRMLEEPQDRHASLADNEQGLADDNNARHVAEPDRSGRAALADEEEHVLRCL